MSTHPLTIWVFNHYALPVSEAGGSRHYALARELIASGHRVYLIAACRNYQAPERSRLKANEDWRLERIEGVPFLWVKTAGYRTNGAGRLWNMLTYAIRVVRSDALRSLPAPDVIIGSSPHPFAAVAAWRAARTRGVPFILEVRDLWPQSLIDIGGLSRWHPLIVLLRAIEGFLYRQAAVVVSLLPGARDHIRAITGEMTEVEWIPNGVDIGMVPWPNDTPPLPSAPFTVMYAGAHGSANGLDVVLEAAAILEARGLADQYCFRLIGNGPEKKRLELRATELRLQSVRFESAIPKAEIYQRLTEAHAFLMILKDSPVFRWGVSPNKLFDYLATGRPIIFGVSTPYNPVQAAGAGYTVPPGDAMALATAIETLKNCSPLERAEMGARGRAYVLEKHGFQQLATRFDVLCREVVNRPRDTSYRRGRARFGTYGVAKRTLDVGIAVLLLILAAPLMLLIICVIALTMGSPVFFRQERIGTWGRPFVVLKFRTMHSSATSTWDPSTDDGRLSAVGRFLRRWSLDELPQLLNVLRGEMSLVGPRPLPVEYLSRYSLEQARRHEAQPGITGWAQVNGRNTLDWAERFAHDVWYVNNRSMMLDLRILWRTASQVLRGNGISADGAATMKEFVGSPESRPSAATSLDERLT